jgi:hypothetical protein
MALNMRASERHFADHLAPIWHALEPDERGVFSIHPAHRAWLLERHSIDGTRDEPPGPYLVASWGDLKRARLHGPVVYMEHGAGQTYEGQNSGSYIGSGDRDGCVAVLVPGPYAERAQRAAWPDIPCYPIGCPKLDRWHGKPAPEGQTIAVTWHWQCFLIKETETAFMHYRPGLRQALAGYNVLGHCHPRGDRRMARLCEHAGWEYTRCPTSDSFPSQGPASSRMSTPSPTAPRPHEQ